GFYEGNYCHHLANRTQVTKRLRVSDLGNFQQFLLDFSWRDASDVSIVGKCTRRQGMKLLRQLATGLFLGR
ncbi:MAG: hypothetical protein L0H28_01115, partial [Corynebacterium casei]|nr:hypothetical protein [Corynebacterium casei]